MKKAFCTFAVGEYEECLEVSRPGFQRFCKRHGYDYKEHFPYAVRRSLRPPAWGKVVLLIELLMSYDLVMWLDCDTLILDSTKDCADLVPDWAVQAITKHIYNDMVVPSTGLWIVKPDALPYLEKIWGMEEFIDHIWWEQAALHNLLGYTQHEQYLNPFPVRTKETALHRYTYFLSEEWNSIDFRNYGSSARIMHFPTLEPAERAQEMQEWLDLYGNQIR